jgi:NAD(P)-dependent dehydrogenase (short-subunit alcohol dehydrogenase family)
VLDPQIVDLESGAYMLDCGEAALGRTRQLVERYGDLSLGFVDAAVIACAERSGGRVLTFELRDFGVVAVEGTITILPSPAQQGEDAIRWRAHGCPAAHRGLNPPGGTRSAAVRARRDRPGRPVSPQDGAIEGLRAERPANPQTQSGDEGVEAGPAADRYLPTATRSHHPMGWTAADIPDLTGRIAVVTGANGGLGLETARELTRTGAHVVMAVRDREKAVAARDSIAREIPGASLELVTLDLGSLESVHTAASAMLAAHPVVDILVNNAGVMGIPYRTTADGFEMQLGVNHLGHFALTALLAPALLRSRGARVVSITSFGRFLGRPIDPADLSMERRYDPWRAYGRSKLANLQFAVELNRLLAAAGSPAKACAADPGMSHTDLQARSAREMRGLSQRFFDAAAGRVGTSPAHGALPQLRAAADPRAVGGALYGLRFVIGGPPVRNRYLVRGMTPADLAAMWGISEQMTGVRFDVTGLVRAAAGEWLRG